MQNHLPTKGKSWEQIESYFNDIQAMDPDTQRGAFSCYSMKGSDEEQEVLKKAYLRFFHHNGVVRRMMPGVCQLEEELLGTCATILSGGLDGVVANITSGGSESIFCAIHAIREWARDKRKSNGPFEIIAPFSAHPSFSKACHYLDIKLTRVKVGPDYRADVDAMRDAITDQTVALVGSAPCWPYGLFDPIAELSALALEKGLWLHTDACVGGYLSPFITKAGYTLPDWDFRLDGVMSISADLHKYAYAAKPASTIAWRSDKLLKYHHVSPSDWPGSAYMTQGFSGSRPIGSVAAAYAILNYLGEEGYVRLAKQAMQNKKRLLDGIAKIPGLKAWDTEVVLAYYESEDENIPVQKIVGGLNELGWSSFGTQQPPIIQLCVEPYPADGSLIDMYLSDLKHVMDAIQSGSDVKAGNLSYAD